MQAFLDALLPLILGKRRSRNTRRRHQDLTTTGLSQTPNKSRGKFGQFFREVGYRALKAGLDENFGEMIMIVSSTFERYLSTHIVGQDSM